MSLCDSHFTKKFMMIKGDANEDLIFFFLNNCGFYSFFFTFLRPFLNSASILKYIFNVFFLKPTMFFCLQNRVFFKRTVIYIGYFEAVKTNGPKKLIIIFNCLFAPLTVVTRQSKIVLQSPLINLCPIDDKVQMFFNQLDMNYCHT